jgi:hypothetical protein
VIFLRDASVAGRKTQRLIRPAGPWQGAHSITLSKF